jgi:hypothetical protein
MNPAIGVEISSTMTLMPFRSSTPGSTVANKNEPDSICDNMAFGLQANSYAQDQDESNPELNLENCDQTNPLDTNFIKNRMNNMMDEKSVSWTPSITC